MGFRWLTQARQHRAFELTAIKVDPRFDLLKDDRRFAESSRARSALSSAPRNRNNTVTSRRPARRPHYHPSSPWPCTQPLVVPKLRRPLPPTHVRWFPILTMVAVGTMINYLDRTVLGIAAPFMTRDLGLERRATGSRVLRLLLEPTPPCRSRGGSSWTGSERGSPYFLAVVMSVVVHRA